MQIKLKPTLNANRVVPRMRLLACLALLALATGCSRAPSFNILGSFFPAWILCGVIGIALTVIVRIVFVRVNFEQELSPLIVVYPCLAVFFTFSIWLLFFS
jgi:YtcA-like protein